MRTEVGVGERPTSFVPNLTEALEVGIVEGSAEAGGEEVAETCLEVEHLRLAGSIAIAHDLAPILWDEFDAVGDEVVGGDHRSVESLGLVLGGETDEVADLGTKVLRASDEEHILMIPVHIQLLDRR